MPALNDLVEDVPAFRHYLQAERGMADNTVLAYGHDLDRYAAWVAGGRLRGLPARRPSASWPTTSAYLREEQLAPASVARHLVALKMFYRFLRLEERADAGGRRTARLAGPVGAHPHGAVARRASRSCSPPRCPADRFYLRDRALLETLYATGCRASEVVGPASSPTCTWTPAFCKCVRQGEQAADRAARAAGGGGACGRTWASGRPWRRRRPPSRRGSSSAGRAKRLTREMLWVIVKKYVQRAGLPRQGQPAHAAAQLRHAPAVRRGRPAGGAGDARPRQHPDDAALHPRGPRPAQGDPPPVPPAGVKESPRPSGRGL